MAGNWFNSIPFLLYYYYCSRWLAYSQECALTVMDYHTLYKYGKELANNWSPFGLQASQVCYGENIKIFPGISVSSMNSF